MHSVIAWVWFFAMLLCTWPRSIRPSPKSGVRRSKCSRTLTLFPEDCCGGWLCGFVCRICAHTSNSTGSPPLACQRAGRGTRWDQVLQVLVAYSLVSPGNEWRLRREWFDASAMAYRLQRERSERGGGCRFSTGNYAIFLAIEQSMNYGSCSCFPVASPYSCPCASRRPHPADHRTATRRTRPPSGLRAAWRPAPRGPRCHASSSRRLPSRDRRT